MNAKHFPEVIMCNPQSVPLVRERLLGEAVVVELSGEVDACSAPRLSSYLDSLSDQSEPDVVVDLRKVTFIDCSGLSVLVRLRNRVCARSGRVRLVCSDPRTLKTLHLTRLSGHFPILADPPDSSRSVDQV
ncbi:STAS domain-containing protein [Wenjunlia tyrosinilytica]|nr:STAS domain-containing protein [Wenjunlia tyrosinilytica]